jgi:hypothetical protein
MTGPYLYDDEPAPLHTGTPRRANGLLLAIFGGTAVVAVLMVLALFLLKGSEGDQAQESVGVFLAALEQRDTETAHELLCAEERANVSPGDIATRYLAGTGGKPVDARAADVDGESAQEVVVEWDDGSRSTFVVVREDGPHVCGTD